MANVANQFSTYYNFSAAAYNTYNQSTGRSIAGWTPVRVDTFSASDPYFAAQLYTDGAGHYRVAMRGSEATDKLADFRTADLALAAGQWHGQLTDAVNFVGQAILQIQRNDNNLSLDDIRSSLDVTGHSLGGSLAEITAKFWGIRGMNIDGPGTSNQVGSSEFNTLKAEYQVLLPDLKSSYTLSAGDFQAREYSTVGMGIIGSHISDANVFLSPKVISQSSVNDSINTISVFTGNPEIFVGGRLVTAVVGVFNHPMGEIGKAEGLSIAQINLSKGLSASGYEVGSVHYLSDKVSNKAIETLVSYDTKSGLVIEIKIAGTVEYGANGSQTFIATSSPIAYKTSLNGTTTQVSYLTTNSTNAINASQTLNTHLFDLESAQKTGIVKIVEWMDGGQIATRLNANLAPIETANIYVVKAGDSLSALSQLRDVPISVLLAYNPQITDPSKIIAGEQIYIPLQLPLLHGFNSSLTVATSADGTLPNIDSIAYANGLERFQLQAANPGLD